MIVKTKEFKQNDIYFMEILLDIIIINDNYNGILIYDSNMILKKKLRIFEDITIYSSFNNSYEEILLFCPDNECLVHINIVNYEYKVIYLENGLENLIFSALYEWNDNGLVLTTNNGEFYSVCIYEKKIHKIDYKDIRRLYPKLYEFHLEFIKHKVVKVFYDEYIAIINNDKCNISILNLKKKSKQILSNATINFHDIEFMKGIYAIVNEKAIEIISIHDNVVLYPNKDCIFLKARFLSEQNDIYLVALSSSQTNVNYSRMELYKLSAL